MQQYRIQLLDPRGIITVAFNFAGLDDAAALQEAETLKDGHAIEVWCGDRKVGRIEKRDAAESQSSGPASRNG